MDQVDFCFWAELPTYGKVDLDMKFHIKVDTKVNHYISVDLDADVKVDHDLEVHLSSEAKISLTGAMKLFSRYLDTNIYVYTLIYSINVKFIIINIKYKNVHIVYRYKKYIYNTKDKMGHFSYENSQAPVV